MKSKSLLIQAFDEPNHTQTPNKFFDMIPDMGDAELRVTLVMIRNTFGYHREGFKMGIGKLAAAAGLTDNGARIGARAAEERGIFKRANPYSQKEAEWTLNVTPNGVDPQPSTPLPPTTLTPTPNGVDHIQPIKESIKESIKETKLTIENAIATGQPVTEEMVNVQSLRDTAPKMFEYALGFSKPLPWWSDKDWTAFAEWVCAEYSSNKISFGEYNIWRNTPYTKGGISNQRIRGFVAEFYDSWDMFRMKTKIGNSSQERSFGL